MSYKKHRSRKPLSLNEARLRMTDSIKRLEEIIMTSDDPYKVVQASNSLSSIINRYGKLTEKIDLEKRIEKLEQQLNPSEDE